MQLRLSSILLCKGREGQPLWPQKQTPTVCFQSTDKQQSQKHRQIYPNRQTDPHSRHPHKTAFCPFDAHIHGLIALYQLSKWLWCFINSSLGFKRFRENQKLFFSMKNVGMTTCTNAHSCHSEATTTTKCRSVTSVRSQALSAEWHGQSRIGHIRI